MKSFAGLVLLLGLAALVSRAGAAEGRFDFETVRERARQLAAQPYKVTPSPVPEWLQKLTYDQHRLIQFDQKRTFWRDDKLPFQLQFFHPGFILNQTVQISEIRDGRAEPIAFDPGFFIYDRPKLKIGELPPTMGFAGFRMMYPLNLPGDELGAFQGASYFRLLCQRAVYGLSSRGLALNTAEAGGEEFPRFTEFWLERPAPAAKTIVVYALLDSESVAGAYRFTITPGAETLSQVKLALYFRKDVKTVGIAPLTSMFWHGENSNDVTDDFRPEVHDSDGLMLATGGGEWLWRPLTDPKTVQVAAFSDENPHGFGLLQRDRRFEDYQDLEAGYHLRPSAWVEPVGNWGKGSVRLVEIPTADETNDNIVAFWTPAKLPAPGQPVDLEYRLHWFMGQIRPPAGSTLGTRHGRSRTNEPDVERFIVDFEGPALNRLAANPETNPEGKPLVEAVVDVGAGAKLTYTTVQKNPFNNTWRVSFGLRPDDSKHPVELRCFLRKKPDVLTETWSYLWQP